MSRNANTAAKLFHRGVLYVMLGLLFYMNRAEAASAENEYVTVSCGTAGVESIVSINEDFYITTRGVSAPDFEADVQVEAKSVLIGSRMNRVRKTNGRVQSRLLNWISNLLKQMFLHRSPA